VLLRTGEAGGGGGAGGYRESPGTASGSYAVSPLGASPSQLQLYQLQQQVIQLQ
jgi:hypothetical protein